MRSFIVCAILAVSVIQLVRGDGYSAPTVGYSYDYSDGYNGAVTVTKNVCQGVVANLGIPGCTDALKGYGSGAYSSDGVNCYSACVAYVGAFVTNLKAGGVVTIGVSGSVTIVRGFVAVGAGGLLGGLVGAVAGLVKGVVGAALELTVDALRLIKGIAGGVIGGLLGGVPGTLDAVLLKLNILINLTGSATYRNTCAASSQCNGYTAPTY